MHIKTSTKLNLITEYIEKAFISCIWKNQKLIIEVGLVYDLIQRHKARLKRFLF